MTLLKNPNERVQTLDLAIFKDHHSRCGSVLSYLVREQYFRNDDRYVELSEIQVALGLRKMDRTQWSRIAIKIQEFTGSLLERKTKTVGPWRLRKIETVSWVIGSQAASPESLALLLNLAQTSVSGDHIILRKRLNAEACELLASAERRYRMGALMRAREAIDELERVVDGGQSELFVACKVRKLRILHRLNDWKSLEIELKLLVVFRRKGSVQGDIDVALMLIIEIYSIWQQYNLIRSQAKECRAT